MKIIPAIVLKVLTVVIFFSFGPDIIAQENIEIEEEDDFYYLQFHEGDGTPLQDLIFLCQKITAYPIQFSTMDIEEVKINIIGRQKIEKSVHGFFNYFQSVLVSYEFICAFYGPEDNPFFVTIKKMNQSSSGARGGELFKAQAPVVSLDEIERYKDSPGRLITTTIQLKYIDARQTLTSMSPYFSSGSALLESVRSVENSNSLIITAFANKVYYVLKLIKLMDVEVQEVETKFIKRVLNYAVAEELEPILTNLITASQTRRTGGSTSPNRSSGTGMLNEPEPKIIAEPRTRSLLVTGSEETTTKILDWIDQLDVEVDPKGDIHVYRLKNTLATDMEGVLTEILQGEQGRGSTRNRRPTSTSGSRATPTAVSSESMAMVVADEASNSLVITATKTKYAQILEVIKMLDIRRKQVLIECAIVEITGRIDKAMGVELAGIDLKAEGGGSYQRPFGFSNFGLSELLDTDDDGIPDQRSPNIATGFTGGIFEGDGFAIPFILTTLSRKTDANILSMPSILTNNNEKAMIKTEDEQPAFSINHHETTSSETFNGYEKAGITLEISPSISAGNYLKLEVDITVSDFDEISDVNPPPRSTRVVETFVTIPDGHTMIIGGIVAKDTTRVENKVPFLGDLPLIGWLFRSTSNAERKTNLYVFVTPHIIDDFAKLDDISFRKKKEVQTLDGDVILIDPDFEYSNVDSRMIDAGLMSIFDIPSYAEPDTGETTEEYIKAEKEKKEESEYGDL